MASNAPAAPEVPAIDIEKKPSLKKFSEQLKKSFTPRTSSRASTPAGPSAAATPKAGASGSTPRDVAKEAKAAAKAAKETVQKKASAAAAATKDAANKAGAAARDAGAKAKKAINVRFWIGGKKGGGVEGKGVGSPRKKKAHHLFFHPTPHQKQSEEGKKGIKAVGSLAIAAAIAAGAYLLNEQREKKPAPAKVPEKKGFFSFAKPAPPPPPPPAKKFWAFGK